MNREEQFQKQLKRERDLKTQVNRFFILFLHELTH